MTRAGGRPVSVVEFERHAVGTDKLSLDMDTPLLGLVGEVGSLVSALKKKRRDTDGFFGYHDAVLEELGDVLWYMSAVARRGHTSLADVVARAVPSGSVDRVRLDDIATGEPSAVGRETFETALLQLAGEAGDIAKRFAERAYQDNVDALRGDLIKFIRPLGWAARAAEVSLDEAGLRNIAKTEDRWPTKIDFPPLFDEGLHVDEQLPRLFRVEIYERAVDGKNFVFQKSGGILLGDRLTDNQARLPGLCRRRIIHPSTAARKGSKLPCGDRLATAIDIHRRASFGLGPGRDRADNSPAGARTLRNRLRPCDRRSDRRLIGLQPAQCGEHRFHAHEVKFSFARAHASCSSVTTKGAFAQFDLALHFLDLLGKGDRLTHASVPPRSGEMCSGAARDASLYQKAPAAGA
jgi:NTP pyrophosphatase (non-canonical NTP hydrolase)